MPLISSSMQSLLERALSVRKKSQGGYKMALFGAEIRRRLINLIDEVELRLVNTRSQSLKIRARWRSIQN